MGRTTISWTDVTDNIIVVDGGGWWCRMISEGCIFCYAAEMNQSAFFGGNKLPYTGAPPKLKLREDIIDGWKAMRTPRRHFVSSMTDVFGDWVPFDWAVRFLRGMWCAPKQIFQVLTKRPDVARDYIERWLKLDGLTRVPDNIWIGTSVENQHRADQRIPLLLSIPAKVRFLSVEPMLGPISLNNIKYRPGSEGWLSAFNGGAWPELGKVNWVIFGGESGPNARPCNIEWIRDGVRQCRAAGVAPFVKQVGTRAIGEKCGHPCDQYLETTTCTCTSLGGYPLDLKHPKGGDMIEWPEDVRVREFPELAKGEQ